MLKIGASSIDITPPLGLMIQAAMHEKRAKSVHSPLEANTLYPEPSVASTLVSRAV